MKSSLTTWLATLAIASSANALSLTIETDKETFLPGDTITITATLDTTGAPAGQLVDVTVAWDSSVASALGATPILTLGSSSQLIVVGVNAGSSNLTSLGGLLPWTALPENGCVLVGPGAGNTCILLSQSQGVGLQVPDPAILVGTLELLITGPGSLGLEVVTLEAFGVPEPTAAALLGLGLVGLGIARRRRATV